MTYHAHIRDHYLPPDRDAFRRAEPPTGRIVVIAPTRAACETIELAVKLHIPTLLEREHGAEIREFSRRDVGFGIVAGTGTGKTLGIRLIAEEKVGLPLRIGVVNREREATPETSTWNVIIVTTGIARRWFQGDLISSQDTIVVDEIHQTSAELELCLALGKRVGCRFIWLSATVDPAFYRDYLDSAHVLEVSAFDPGKAANVVTEVRRPLQFLDSYFLGRVMREKRGVAVFLPTRAETEEVAEVVAQRRPRLFTAFYHGGEPIRVLRPFLDGTADKPFLLAMTAAGQSALNIQGLDTVVIYDAQYRNVIEGGRNVLTRLYLGANEILQMAGRVHGRVPNGEVCILTNRAVEFESLRPGPPEFQLAGDSERVAITAAALGVDLTALQLPVPLDRRAYRRAVERLVERGIVEDGRLTEYGRDVEAMPVERPWGELLVLTDDALTPYIAVMANVESLHRLTKEDRDLRGLAVTGSDHLTAYNVFAEAVEHHGFLGTVHGLPRHLFEEGIAEWAERRGVSVKGLEDIALGTASVYRTLELPLPERLPRAGGDVLRRFRDLLARVMPLDLVLDEATSDGQAVRVSRGSLAGAWGAVAGTIRYFADADGSVRAAIEGTNVPFDLMKRYARRSGPRVEYRRGRTGGALDAVETTTYFGFELGSSRRPLTGAFPEDLVASAHRALLEALLAGLTSHPHQGALRRALDRAGEYWRRAGGTLPAADPSRIHGIVRAALSTVTSWDDFLETPLRLDIDSLIEAPDRGRLDALPSSVRIRGDRAALDYEIENGVGVVRLRLREGQARRLRNADLPDVDRPLRFAVMRGRKGAIRASDIDELRHLMASLPREKRATRRPRRHRRR